jgi:hypothetical protein
LKGIIVQAAAKQAELIAFDTEAKSTIAAAEAAFRKKSGFAGFFQTES